MPEYISKHAMLNKASFSFAIFTQRHTFPRLNAWPVCFFQGLLRQRQHALFVYTLYVECIMLYSLQSQNAHTTFIPATLCTLGGGVANGKLFIGCQMMEQKMIKSIA